MASFNPGAFLDDQSWTRITLTAMACFNQGALRINRQEKKSRLAGVDLGAVLGYQSWTRKTQRATLMACLNPGGNRSPRKSLEKFFLFGGST